MPSSFLLCHMVRKALENISYKPIEVMAGIYFQTAVTKRLSEHSNSSKSRIYSSLSLYCFCLVLRQSLPDFFKLFNKTCNTRVLKTGFVCSYCIIKGECRLFFIDMYKCQTAGRYSRIKANNLWIMSIYRLWLKDLF